MAKCPICGGEKTPSKTTFSVDLGEGVVVVRSVPAQMCSQCGEEWIDNEIAKNLEEIVQQAKKRHLQVEVLTFQ